MTLHCLLNPVVVEEMAREWLREDQPSLDVGLLVVGEADCTAYLWCKSPGVLAGVPFVNAVLSQLECDVKWLRNEGEWLNPVAKVAEVSSRPVRAKIYDTPNLLAYNEETGNRMEARI